MDDRSRRTFSLMVGAAAVICWALFFILDGAVQYVFLVLGVVIAGSGAMPPRFRKRREPERRSLTPGDFSVVLSQPGDHPIQVIKTLRAVADLDLESAHRFVQTAPSIMVREVSHDGATAISEALTGSGAEARVERA